VGGPSGLQALRRECTHNSPPRGPTTTAGARGLARSVVTLYGLAAQQLSRADHYDWGLRSLRSVLLAAGALRRAAPADSPEPALLLRAVTDVNLPRLVREDVPLFHGLLGDAFPGVAAAVSPPLTQHAGTASSIAILHAALVAECARAGLQPHPGIIAKALELADAKATRHCVMLVGRTHTGKSTVWRLLAAAQTALAAASPSGSGAASPYRRVRVETVNHKALSLPELYGCYEEAPGGAGEWRDGMLAALFRGFARGGTPAGPSSSARGAPSSLSPLPHQHQHQEEESWLVLDGPVDGSVESLNMVRGRGWQWW
jgi:dynein heavy chain, axonemal